jgi:hypothetical protein
MIAAIPAARGTSPTGRSRPSRARRQAAVSARHRYPGLMSDANHLARPDFSHATVAVPSPETPAPAPFVSTSMRPLGYHVRVVPAHRTTSRTASRGLTGHYFRISLDRPGRCALACSEAKSTHRSGGGLASAPGIRATDGETCKTTHTPE